MWRSDAGRLRRAIPLLALLVGACATVPPPLATPAAVPVRTEADTASAPEPAAAVPAPGAPRPALAVSTIWTGRFSATWRDPKITAPALGPDGDDRSLQRVSGRFELRERVASSGDPRPQSITLDVASPLGTTLARARTDSTGASLELADGQRFSAADAESLTFKVLGWRVPVARLPGWLRGEEPSPGERWQVGVEELRGTRPARVLLRWPADGPQAVSLRLLVDDPERSEE